MFPDASDIDTPKYRPGPKSKKAKLLITPSSSNSAPISSVAAPPFRDETLHSSPREDDVVNVSDSDDDIANNSVAKKDVSFDDIFGAGAREALAAAAAPPVVFNKDSNDEGEPYSAVAASVAELMGDSDEEMFK